MSDLRILMADDHLREIEKARSALEDVGHKVSVATTFDKAMELAQSESYDIAVIDLGWYTDRAHVESVGKEVAARSGQRILDEVKSQNPTTVRILYSQRADEPDIIRYALERDIFP